MEKERRRGTGGEEDRMNGVKCEVGYGGLRDNLAPTGRRNKSKQKLYRLGGADIFSTVDVDDF